MSKFSLNCIRKTLTRSDMKSKARSQLPVLVHHASPSCTKITHGQLAFHNPNQPDQLNGPANCPRVSQSASESVRFWDEACFVAKNKQLWSISEGNIDENFIHKSYFSPITLGWSKACEMVADCYGPSVLNPAGLILSKLWKILFSHLLP